ncbi:MAG: hemolysin III family protein [Bacilli bacterium]|nr:hemolysin III family protein [Bacilli bacterium]MDD4006020.1 hemolysin III family protein [Bacilli bacterium]
MAEIKETLEKQPMPKYSSGEETFNWISHAIGIAVGLVMLGVFITLSVLRSYSFWENSALIVYSLTIIILYATSTIYHALPNNQIRKKIFRLLDHNTIYLLIAGTYAPICAFAFPGTNYGFIIMVVQIIGLLIGTIMNFINLNGKATQIITVALYVVMGWSIVIFYPAMKMMPLNIILFILFGGISYTLGVVFYAIGRKIKWMHSIFHLFVFLGTILQLVGIVLLI